MLWVGVVGILLSVWAAFERDRFEEDDPARTTVTVAGLIAFGVGCLCILGSLL